MNRIEVIIAIILVLLVGFSLLMGTTPKETSSLPASIDSFLSRIIK